jgi:hypothetical protein
MASAANNLASELALPSIFRISTFPDVVGCTGSTLLDNKFYISKRVSFATFAWRRFSLFSRSSLQTMYTNAMIGIKTAIRAKYGPLLTAKPLLPEVETCVAEAVVLSIELGVVLVLVLVAVSVCLSDVIDVMGWDDEVIAAVVLIASDVGLVTTLPGDAIKRSNISSWTFFYV